MIYDERIQRAIAKVLQSEHIIQTPAIIRSFDDDLFTIQQAFREYQSLSLKEQTHIINHIRSLWLANMDPLVDCSMRIQQGIAVDKQTLLNHLLQHTLDAKSIASESITGDYGLTLIDYSAYGIFLIVLPHKHTLETLINHVIALLSAGNAVVFVTQEKALEPLNQALSLIEPLLQSKNIKGLISLYALTEQSKNELFNHPNINAIINDNPQLILDQSILTSKKVFLSKPAPVSVIVDDSADLKVAAKQIIKGASFDNNLLFCAEKLVIVTESAYDYLAHALSIHGGVWDDNLKRHLFSEEFNPKAYYGKSLMEMAKALSLTHIKNNAGNEVALLTLEEDELTMRDYRLYCGLPILFVVKARSVEHAINMAAQMDQQQHFVSIMHSKNVDHLSLCARVLKTSIFIKNAPSFAALGMGGEGYPSMFVANITGEGPLHPKDYMRKRRCVLAEGFLIR